MTLEILWAADPGLRPVGDRAAGGRRPRRTLAIDGALGAATLMIATRRDMQNSGVPTKKAVGLPFTIASFNVIWCMSQAGLRVQIGLTPWLLATVGVTLGIAGSPGIFVWEWPLSWTWRTLVPTRCVAVV